MGQKVRAEIKLSDVIRTYTVTIEGSEEELTLTPAWFGNCVWIGAKPEENVAETTTQLEVRPQDLIIDNVPGRIILNQLSSGTGERLHTSHKG